MDIAWSVPAIRCAAKYFVEVSANIDLARAGFDAWNRNDLDAWLQMLDSEIEFHPAGVFPDFEPAYRGHDGLGCFWRAIYEPWQELRVEIDYIEERADCVVVTVRYAPPATTGYKSTCRSRQLSASGMGSLSRWSAGRQLRRPGKRSAPQVRAGRSTAHGIPTRVSAMRGRLDIRQDPPSSDRAGIHNRSCRRGMTLAAHPMCAEGGSASPLRKVESL
jgi:ketosteroid isomerase-like protein